MRLPSSLINLLVYFSLGLSFFYVFQSTSASLESETLSRDKRLVVLALIRRSLVPKASLVLSQQAPTSTTQPNNNNNGSSSSNSSAKLSSAPCGLRVLEQSLAAVARGNSKSLANFLRADNAPDLLLRLSAAARSHPTWHGKRRLAAVVRAVFCAAVTARDAESSDRQ